MYDQGWVAAHALYTSSNVMQWALNMVRLRCAGSYCSRQGTRNNHVCIVCIATPADAENGYTTVLQPFVSQTPAMFDALDPWSWTESADADDP